LKVCALFLAVFVTVGTSGCCVFGPCDRVSIFVGRVSTAEGLAVPNAQVTAFGNEAKTDRNGCFDVGGIEMGSPQLTVVAPGSKPLVVPAKSGMYQVMAVVAPVGTATDGTVRWVKSPKGRPASAPGCT